MSEHATTPPLDRRQFLQAAAALGAASAAALSGCDQSLRETDEASLTLEALE